MTQESDPQNDSTPRRFLIAVGVGEYPNLKDGQLPNAEQELNNATKLFCDLGYTRVLPSISLNPTRDAFRAQVHEWLQTHPHKPKDLLTFYFSGHGFDDGDQHYLLFSDSSLENLDGSAMAVADLARLILKSSQFDQSLVILDTCYGGSGSTDFSDIFSRLKNTFTPYLSSGVFVLAAARSWERAVSGAFTDALANAVACRNEQWGGKTQPFLFADAVVGLINEYLAVQSIEQKAVLNALDITSQCRLIPNPRYNRNVPLGVDLESQRTTDFTHHWMPRAQGAETTSNAWYFTGRERALREIVGWLNNDKPDSNVVVVTGAAGTGKSALLARLVTLSDPRYRQQVRDAGALNDAQPDTIPAEGSIDIAIQARGKSLLEVIDSIASSLNLTLHSTDLLLKALEIRKKRLVILLDALDEAVGSQDIVNALLKKLSALENVRLIIGSRPLTSDKSRIAIPELSNRRNEINLDLPKYIGASDVATYVAARLLARSEPQRKTPYRARDDLAGNVAAAVAARAGNNFLVARIVTSNLLNGDRPLGAEEVAKQTFPTGVFEAFDSFLGRLDGLAAIGFDKTVASDLMKPLAYAAGQGLPRENIWATIASAIAGRH